MLIQKKIILLLSTFVLWNCGKDSDNLNDETLQDPIENLESADAIFGNRIAWDFTTKKIISDPEDSGYNGYPRLIELQDGSLLATYESQGNVIIKKSSDKGENWAAPILVASFNAGVNMATPDVIQLQNGTILLAYNPRPGASAAPNEKFLIKTILSNDGGLNWLNDQVVYEGDTVFENGVWEPSVIQLPNGEIQLFFSNENVYRNSNEQNISLIRSLDNGVTWTTDPEIASFRAGSRDGMPSPLLLNDHNTIVYSIEDNGINNQFKPYIIRNTLTENWKQTVNGNSTNRNYSLQEPLDNSEYAGAPYLAKFSTGEILLSYQGTENRNGNDLNNADMKVAIGSITATDFNRTSVPFIIPEGKSALWNSISVLSDDTVVALTTTNAYSNNNAPQVWMIKGHLIPEKPINYGTLNIDGETAENYWTESLPIFIGQKSNTQLHANIISDNENLYILTKVNDAFISKTSTSIQNNDGTVLYLDPMKKNYVVPGSGVFKIIISVSNQIQVFEGYNSNWQEVELPEIETIVNENIDGYIQETKIPWNSIGGKPNKNSHIGMTMELIERGNSLYTETLSGTKNDKPNTWLNLKITQ
ncbi:hypothetical protein NO995_13415 [Aestuariibaculum sp. M13]|uniref:sugar-binding protein n=1 Tax=Aestuariibaculum sp. M13 TaxID=2967132 RepID=UPI00215A04D9|nr:sugar-binding protein [Aestuariibaculum sp. M13]MCR8668686.1 hypothetical protein [Aestuariibaculum sp. M13]